MVERHRRGEIVSVLQWHELAVVGVVFEHMHMRLQDCMLLRLPRKLGGPRQWLNRSSGRG